MIKMECAAAMVNVSMIKGVCVVYLPIMPNSSEKNEPLMPNKRLVQPI
jgi:hypothetical protein